VPKSSRVRLTDFRQILRLVGECRDLGDDPRCWRSHLVAGLCRLTGAGMGVAAEMGDCTRGPRRDLGTATWGWENGFDRPTWLRMLAEFRHDPLYNPIMNHYIPRLPRADGDCLTRAMMIRDADWYRSPYYQLLQRTIGADATLICFRAVAGADDEDSEVFPGRAVGEPDFSARDRAIVREAHAAVGPLVGGAPARFRDPAPSDLPPRTRQVLACLLEGDSDKQVAALLRISPATVNGHTKVIYRHFDVEARSELLARWIRREAAARRLDRHWLPGQPAP
jgi:DNA-binding CsgD family transcriptional regulator